MRCKAITWDLTFSANIGQFSASNPDGSQQRKSLLDESDFTIQGSVNLDNSSEFKRNSSRFENYLNSALSRSTDRSYDHTASSRRVNLSSSVKVNNFTLQYLIDHNGRKSSNDVHDKISGVLLDVSTLSHVSRYNALKQESTFGYLAKLFSENFTGRYQQRLNLSLNVGARWYQEQNHSSLDFRNLQQNFFTFLPEVKLDYWYNRNKHFRQNSSLSYTYNELYPTIDDQRPFYDDINPAFRFFGGSDLEKRGRHQLSFRHYYRQEKSHGWMVNLSSSYTLDDGSWADSIRFEQNQERRYLVQDARNLYSFRVGAKVEKSLKLSSKQSLSFDFDGSLFWRDGIQYINGVAQHLAINEQRVSLNMYYSYDARFVVGAINEMRRFERKAQQQGAENRQSQSTATLNSGLSVSYALTKKLAFNTSATNLYRTSRQVDNNFLIWNAHLTQRFSKGNNFEVKLSAFDLLKQNQSIYFENTPTTIRQGERNNLTQYFMVSLSYFPRKFGL